MASGTTIQGNIIGLNAAGTAAVANEGVGITVLSAIILLVARQRLLET